MIKFPDKTAEQAYEMRRRAAAAHKGPIGWRTILLIFSLFLLMWVTTVLKNRQKAHTLPVAPVRQQQAAGKPIDANTANFRKPHHPASHHKTEPD